MIFKCAIFFSGECYNFLLSRKQDFRYIGQIYFAKIYNYIFINIFMSSCNIAVVEIPIHYNMRVLSSYYACLLSRRAFILNQ